MFSNHSTGEDSWISLGQQGDLFNLRIGWTRQPFNTKGNQPCIFIGRTDAEDEAPKLWPPAGKSQLIGKDPDAGKDWGQEKGTAEDEMAGWHHWLQGHEFEQIQGDSEGQKAWNTVVHGVAKSHSNWTTILLLRESDTALCLFISNIDYITTNILEFSYFALDQLINQQITGLGRTSWRKRNDFWQFTWILF